MERVNMKRMYEIINNLDYLFGNKNKSMDLYNMNQWLNRIIEFYKAYGIELRLNDFEVNNPKNNIFLKKYMSFYFNNLDKLDSDIFPQVVFSMNELEFSVDANPMLEIISEAINGINIRNISIFDNLFKIINIELEKIGITKVNLDNISIVKEELKKEIVNDDVTNKIMDKIEKNSDSIETLEKRILSLLIGENCDEDTINKVKNNIYNICLMIIRLKVFDVCRIDYIKYAKKNNYKGILDIVKSKMIKYDNLNQWKEIAESLSNEKVKKLLLSKLNKDMSKLLSECQVLISDYLNSFYININMDSKYDNLGLFDDSKLFGLFDFDKISNASVIKLPDMGIAEIDARAKGFNELSQLALRYVNFETRKNAKRKEK